MSTTSGRSETGSTSAVKADPTSASWSGVSGDDHEDDADDDREDQHEIESGGLRRGLRLAPLPSEALRDVVAQRQDDLEGGAKTGREQDHGEQDAADRPERLDERQPDLGQCRADDVHRSENLRREDDERDRRQAAEPHSEYGRRLIQAERPPGPSLFPCPR